MTLKATSDLSVGVRYSIRESTIPGRGRSEIVSPYIGYRVTPWLRITPYAVFGVSTNSPDWGTGLVVRFTARID